MAKKKYGDPRTFDPNFKGPVHDRSCTDVFCCVLFILALLGYIAVSALAYSQGDLWKLIHPRDSSGQKCGQIGTPQENKTLLFFFNISECRNKQVVKDLKCHTTQICVEKCPERSLSLVNITKNNNDSDTQYYLQFCKKRVNAAKTPEVLNNKMCPKRIRASRPIMNRCLLYLKKKNVDINLNDTDLKEAKKKSDQAVEFQQEALRIFDVFIKSWHSILIGLVIAMLLSLLFIYLLRFLAGVIIWTAIILVILDIGFDIFQCYFKYKALKGHPSSNVTIEDLQTDFPQTPSMWLALTIILGIVELVILLLIIYLRKRISFAIALIKEASKLLTHMMSLLFYPLLTFALLSLVIAYWAMTSIWLYTSKESIYKVSSTSGCKYSGQKCDPETFNSSKVRMQCPGAECLFAFYGGETFLHKHQIMFQSYNMFMLNWCVNFVMALGQMTLAGAFASYYWTFKKPADIPPFPVFSSLGRALRYHTGSLAFGSLVLSFNKVAKTILKCLEKLLKVTAYCADKFNMACPKCFLSSLDYSMKFFNSNTYIMIAIYGESFWPSAKDVFHLLMRNIKRVAKVDRVACFLLYLGRLLIVVIMLTCSIFFFTEKIKAEEEVLLQIYDIIPILTVMIGTYFITSGFFSVYAMCVDTLFVCFLEDLERNDGSEERPYLMSKSLQKNLNKKKFLTE